MGGQIECEKCASHASWGTRHSEVKNCLRRTSYISHRNHHQCILAPCCSSSSRGRRAPYGLEVFEAQGLGAVGDSLTSALELGTEQQHQASEGGFLQRSKSEASAHHAAKSDAPLKFLRLALLQPSQNRCSLDRHSQQYSCIVLLWERPDDSTQVRSVHERTCDELLALGAGGGGGGGEGGGGVRRASGPAFRGTAGAGGGETEGPGGPIVAGTVTIGTPPAV